ncbi:MAG: deaminase [Phycisphaerae bacterium]
MRCSSGRKSRLVYGATDPKAGAVESVFRLLDEPRLNHKVEVTHSILAAECGAVLSDFFRTKRAEDDAD